MTNMADMADATEVEAYTWKIPIPIPLQFPLVVLLATVLSSLLYSLTPAYTCTREQLAFILRPVPWWLLPTALFAWRVVELACAWFADYDAVDALALVILSHSPPLFLLGTFYEISFTAVLLSLLIDALATYIPFRLLRQHPLAQAALVHQESTLLPRNEVLTSTVIQIYTTVLAASIYAVTIFAAYNTYLSIYLAVHFENIVTIAPAHSPSYITLFPVTLVFGAAATSLIFNATVTARDDKPTDTKCASLTRVVTRVPHFGCFSARIQIVIKRTLSLVLVSGIHTFLHTFLAIEGVEAIGAVAYLAPWAVAAGITGTVFGLVIAA